MRICFFNFDLPGVGAPLLGRRWELALALAVQGHDVHLLARGPDAHVYRRHGLWIHEVPGQPFAPPLHADPAVNAALSVSQRLFERLVRLSAEGPFDVVDLPVGGGQGFVTLQNYAGPTVAWLWAEPAPPDVPTGAKHAAQILNGLERAAFVCADGVVLAGDATASAVALTAPGTREGVPVIAAPPDPEAATVFYAWVRDFAARSRPRTVFQVMEALDVGDAVSTITRRNARILAELGEPPEILARYHNPALGDEVLPLYRALAQPTGLIFHYWGYNSSTWLLRAVPGPKAIHYHNITPPEFFAHDPALAEVMQRGCDQLRQIADSFDVVIGDSWYNVGEFVQHMQRRVPAVAIYPVIEPAEIRTAPCDEVLLAALRGSGEVNLVFVGRVARNKRQDRLIELFDHYWRTINRHARLWLVGNDRGDPAYREQLEQQRASLACADRVSFTGKVSDEQVNAYYRAADVFICASEHEGFCMPIVQAMALDVPVLAYAAAAVPETMGGSGLLVQRWDVPQVAELLHLTVRDCRLRAALVSGQRAVLGRFSEHEARTRLEGVVQFLRGERVSLGIEETPAPAAGNGTL